MIVKTRKQILREMIQWSRNNNSDLTDFNQGSVVRAIFGAVAAILSQLYYYTHKLYRSARITYAGGTDLDVAVSPRSITRRGATKASITDVTFLADAGTVIPINFKIATEDGIEFVTVETGTVATGETSIDLDTEAVVAGISGNIRAETLTVLITLLTGVNSVINNTHSEGGFDQETDEMLRNRAITQLATLSKGIQASYEAWAREARSDVLRAIAQANHPTYSEREVVVFLVKNNAGAFTADDLVQIGHYIQTRAPLGVVIVCLNVVWQDIDLTVKVRITAGTDLNTVKTNITINMKLYLDYREWDWGVDVEWSDLFALISNTLGVDEVERATFVPASNVVVALRSLPRFKTITVSEWA